MKKNMKMKVIAIVAVLFVLVGIAFGSPWSGRIWSPQNVTGLAARITALEELTESQALLITGLQGQVADNNSRIVDLESRATILEAKIITLAGPLLALNQDKLLKLLSGRRSAMDADSGWGPHVYDPDSPNGQRWVIGTTYLSDLNDVYIPETEAFNNVLDDLLNESTTPD